MLRPGGGQLKPVGPPGLHYTGKNLGLMSWLGDVPLQEMHAYQSKGEETLVIQMSAKQVFWFDLNIEEQD